VSSIATRIRCMVARPRKTRDMSPERASCRGNRRSPVGNRGAVQPSADDPSDGNHAVAVHQEGLRPHTPCGTGTKSEGMYRAYEAGVKRPSGRALLPFAASRGRLANASKRGAWYTRTPAMIDANEAQEVHLTVELGGKDPEVLVALARVYGCRVLHVLLDTGTHPSQPMLSWRQAAAGWPLGSALRGATAGRAR
jgi:hypothetical protein